VSPALEATLTVAAMFGSLAVIATILLGIHDGIEWLINRRRT